MNHNIRALIISAGYSSRMKDFKPLMKYDAIPFILAVILKTSVVCQEISIVTGYRAEDIEAETERWLNRAPHKRWLEIGEITAEEWKTIHRRITFLLNPDYDAGMFSSLQTGFRIPDPVEWTLYHFVDQPHIPVSFYHQFARQIDDGVHWIQPRFHGINAHPILLHRQMGSLIVKAEVSSDLKSVSQNDTIRKKYWDCDFPQIGNDFDSIEDMYYRET